MSGLIVTGETYEQALGLALERVRLPREALNIQEMGDLGERIDDRPDPSAAAQPGVTLRVSLKPDHVANTARNHLQRILRYMGIRAEIRTIVAPDIIKLKIRAPESALLIGRNGRTLEAFQHVINRMSTQPGIEAPHVALDVEDYLERRLARLERLARRGARQALETGAEVELEIMSPGDRKIVHMTLRSSPAVQTYSRGEEGDRRVIIAPAENARQSQ